MSDTTTLTTKQKKLLTKAVKQVVKQYHQTLIMLGKE